MVEKGRGDDVGKGQITIQRELSSKELCGLQGLSHFTLSAAHSIHSKKLLWFVRRSQSYTGVGYRRILMTPPLLL